ncbi:hypothetical protein [Paenibacillus sp. J22TS3]|uniref:hypothetical protein n=1 Tax=Paenibacillus sp. J22TS3 TaxID=2807192 RepID=UPI001B09AEC6|nr:hypothetical protein [Paenibacillus sp. J22TS3]GIP22977.1 hypothetical protein J22TS3_32520 [Paenibacillus sp. J22TS3]
MNKSRKVFIPAVLLALAALGLILYAVVGLKETRPAHMKPPASASAGSASVQQSGDAAGAPGRPNRPDHGAEGIYKNLGTAAVFLSAISFAWICLKKKRRSASKWLRKGAKLFYAVHTYAGYLAVLLIVVHGIYFLIKGSHQDAIYTGIAAFALLLAGGVYGFLIRRVRNKYMRVIHLGLGSAFLAACLVHAGGSALLAVGGIVVLWVLVGILDRTAVAPQTAA